MFRRLVGAFCLGWIALAVAASANLSAADRPHAVVFLSDDHTCFDSSLYGSEEISTPNMDRIAKQGVTMDRAFVVSPSCAPSRAALLTGLWPQHNGAEANHARPEASIKKWPAYFHELGYEVVAFGKVGHYAQTADYGFDLAKHYEYHDDVAVDEALKWLRSRDDERPLCLMVGTNWPHVPWPNESSHPPADISIPSIHVDTTETRQARSRYLQAIDIMDTELGRVFDTAYEVLGKQTVFVHSSDHGAQWPFAKWNLYEQGLRTPMLVCWPDQIKADRHSSAIVNWLDLLPTLIDAAGGSVPDQLDGKSFLSVLQGKTDTHREHTFATHGGDGNMNVFPMRAIRTERWKYIINLHPEFAYQTHVTQKPGDTGYWPSWVEQAKTNDHAKRVVDRYTSRPAVELYDLEHDPLEQQNLADSAAASEIKGQLHQQLTSWMNETGDQQRVFGTPKLKPLETTPNIIHILVDDMGWSDLGCFGGEPSRTPRIDRLASEGIRFTQFYVNSPICSPSRTALTTGNYPARHRITSYLDNRAANARRGVANWLDPDVTTLAKQLSERGYQVGHFGKWHMGGQRDVDDAPLITQYGFNQSLTNFEGLGPRVLPLCDAFDGSPVKKHDLGSANLGHGPIRWADRSQITGEFVQGALAFIDDATASKRPFYINVWPDDVHSPFYPPQSLRTDEAKRQLYLAVLEAMDKQLATILDRIDQDESLRQNTLIMLCSDNGPEPGAGRSKPLRGVKGQLYEGGIRSPLIVWGPGLIPPTAAGSVNETTALSSVDLVASLQSMLKLNAPDRYHHDGEDLGAMLLGQSTAPRTSPLFWRRPPDRPTLNTTVPAARQSNDAPEKPVDLPDLAVRDGQWKLLCNVDGSGVELYNLNADPTEKNNVAAARPVISKRLTESVLEWNRELPVDGVDPAFVPNQAAPVAQ